MCLSISRNEIYRAATYPATFCKDAKKCIDFNLPNRTGWDDIWESVCRFPYTFFNPPTCTGDLHHSRSYCAARISIYLCRMGGIPGPRDPDAGAQRLQSTHPARGGTPAHKGGPPTLGISIHPPRTGWDSIVPPWATVTRWISIHPPRTGWDPVCHELRIRDMISLHPPRTGWDDNRLPVASSN